MTNLEQLIAINDEVAALVRAGVPLELGLQQVSLDVHGRLRRISAELATALNRGESLPQALEGCGHEFPPVYRAVVEAGLKARNLPRALEAVTAFAHSALELRRRLGLAMIYPVIVLLAAYGLFVGFLVVIEPKWVHTLAGFQFQTTPAIRVLDSLRQTLSYWWPILPGLVLAGMVWWWWSGRSSPLGLAGPMRRVLFRQVHLANFAELLGILVEQRVPLNEALPLAAEATGDFRLIADCRALVQEIDRGTSLAQALPGKRSFPPLLRWLLQATETSPTLAAALQQVAETYRMRALARAEWIKVVVPMLVVLIVGGGATLIYALTLFLPLTQFLGQLMLE